MDNLSLLSLLRARETQLLKEDPSGEEMQYLEQEIEELMSTLTPQEKKSLA